MTGALLASAAAEPGNGDVQFVLVAAFVVAAAAGLVAVPAVVAGRRRHRHRELVVGVGILWGLVTAAAVVWAVNRQWTAADERERDVLSGDVDPRTLPPPPATDWAAWGGVAAAYAGLLAWSAAPPTRRG